MTLLLCAITSSWATDYGTFIVKFESTPSQSRTDGKTGDFFTYSGASQSYTGKYADVDLTDSSKGGLKLNSSGWLRFTTLAPSNIIIVQSDDKNADKGIKINSTGNTSGVANTTDGVVVFTLNNQAAGSYEITNNGKEVGIIYVKVEYTKAPPATYTASFANGGHGSAPSTQEEVAFVTLPTIGENFYAITGWTANQDVTVDEATVTAGTLIAVGKTAYLSANTTFTAQWEESDYPYVDGITFPATLPETALDMGTQSIYTPTNGYVVLEPKADVYSGGSSKNFWLTSINANSSGVKWTSPEGSKYPSSASETSLLALRNDRTFAFKFTGTTEFEAMLNPRKENFEAHVLIADMTSKSIVGNQGAPFATESSKVAALTNDNIKTFSGLDATHTYVAFFYSTCDNTNGVIYGIALKIPATFSKTITAAGWATYYSPYALDFSSSIANLEGAYIVTGNTGTTLNLSDAITTTVPANTGLLLKGNGEVTIPVAASGAYDASANKLKGVTAATVKDANTIYVLMNEAAGVGFYKNSNAFTVGANTAYLNVADMAGFEPTLAPTFMGIGDDNGTTGVETLNVERGTLNDNSYYNLSGQRVAQPTKGLYIVNGKKYVVK